MKIAIKTTSKMEHILWGFVFLLAVITANVLVALC